MSHFEKRFDANSPLQTKKVKLKTFAEVKTAKKSKAENKADRLTNDVDILKLLVKLSAMGRDISIENTIGKYECS